MTEKKALVTGVSGQDGSYLSEQLLRRGYKVAALVRDAQRIPINILRQNGLTIYEVDLCDEIGVTTVVNEFMPDEIYNFAADANILSSYEKLISSAEINILGSLNILLAALHLHRSKHLIKVFQASSAAVFGTVSETPQNELTPMNPNSPYGLAKYYVQRQADILRETEGLFVSTAIFYNHESPRRPVNFVTRKVTAAAACITNKSTSIPKDDYGRPILNNQGKLELGNLLITKDWGYAPEYTEAAYRILQIDKPDNFIIATGIPHTIRDLLDVAFGHVKLNWQDHVVQNPDLERKQEFGDQCGDSTKAKQMLGWKAKTKFEEMISQMVDADLKTFTT